MAQDWSVHALVYFCSAIDDLSGAVFYWRLDLELTDMTSSPAVGGYQLGAITFALPKKPCWIHRMGVRLVLGWKWVDA
jgi:hypothetical protein